jgi:hypothetical protein
MRVAQAFAIFAAAGLVGLGCSDNKGVTIPSGLEIYTAQLNGANEAPTAVTTTATGHAVVTILGNVVAWKVDVDAPIDSLFAGHIHRRAADSAAGNVRVDFTVGKTVAWASGPTGPGVSGTVAQGDTTLTAPGDSMLAIIRGGRSYVNLHTRAHAGGEIRGTLVRVQ